MESWFAGRHHAGMGSWAVSPRSARAKPAGADRTACFGTGCATKPPSASECYIYVTAQVPVSGFLAGRPEQAAGIGRLLGKAADIPVDTGVGSRFQGVDGSRRPQSAF